MSNRQVTVEIQFKEKFGFEVVICISLVLQMGKVKDRKETYWAELLFREEEGWDITRGRKKGRKNEGEESRRQMKRGIQGVVFRIYVWSSEATSLIGTGALWLWDNIIVSLVSGARTVSVRWVGLELWGGDEWEWWNAFTLFPLDTCLRWRWAKAIVRPREKVWWERLENGEVADWRSLEIW